MCSFLFSTKVPTNIEEVNYFLQKRGPDKTNVVYHNNHVFIHNLLSLTGAVTDQPLIDDNVFLLFNGEIYNYQEIASTFKFDNIDNDSKCLLPLFKKTHTNLPHYLDGEFALCIVNYNDNTLLVVSDPFGVKPLFISIENGDIGVSSYYSGLSKSGYNNINKFPPNTTRLYDLQSKEKIFECRTFDFNLDQFKTTYEDWIAAFERSIQKRTQDIHRGLFIGLSSGYDSGAIACELKKQNRDFVAYTLAGTENEDILRKRNDILNVPSISVNRDGDILSYARQYIDKSVEEFMYTVCCARSSYNEFNLRLHDDNGSTGMSVICALAKQDDKRIVLSGCGADEILSDYGFAGKSKYNHSNFGGRFPSDLRTIFPSSPYDKTCIWRSFYGSTMESYLMKDEMISGSYGLEGRFPFLDKYVVQEFLNLSDRLKNSNYKAPLHEYFMRNNFPFQPGQKIGF